MTFSEWFDTQRHWITHEGLCRVAWDAAIKAERDSIISLCDSLAAADDAEGFEAHNAALEAVKLDIIAR